MNDPNLPTDWNRLRVPAPPPELRVRISSVAVSVRRPLPLWPLLWAASIAGLVAVNLWLDARRASSFSPAAESLPSLAELRRTLDPGAFELF
jgi:hypothetical protein